MSVVPIRPDVARALHRSARWWALASLTGFAALAWGVGLPVKAEGDSLARDVERPLQAGLLGVAALAWLASRRWPGAAAGTLALAGAALAGASALSYAPVVVVGVAVAFLVPAVALWLVWQRGRTVAAVAAHALVTTMLLVTTWVVATGVHDRYFGPAHPVSSTPEVAVDRVAWVWSGGVTAGSATVVARLDEAPRDESRVALEVRRDGDGDPSVVRAPADEDLVVRWELGGLQPATDYRYTVVVDGHRDAGRGVGRFRTPVAGPAPVTVAFASCARTGSNGAVFDAIRAAGPDLYVVDGDLHYGNVTDDDAGRFLELYGRVLTAPSQAALYRSVPVAYVWDDHDYGPNGADSGSPSRDAARRAYRQAVPHHPLPAGAEDGAVYQAFTMGRIRFVMTDTRSERTEASMLGARQLDWLLDELRTASRAHALVVWVNPDPWIAPAGQGDGWGAFPDERRRIADAVAGAGIRNLVMLAGDAHMVALDDGTNSDYATAGGAGFPVLHAGALDRPGSYKGGPYSHGAFPGAGQFGLLTVHDDGGDRIAVDLSGRTWAGRTLVKYSYEVRVPATADSATLRPGVVASEHG